MKRSKNSVVITVRLGIATVIAGAKAFLELRLHNALHLGEPVRLAPELARTDVGEAVAGLEEVAVEPRQRPVVRAIVGSPHVTPARSLIGSRRNLLSVYTQPRSLHAWATRPTAITYAASRM